MHNLCIIAKKDKFVDAYYVLSNGNDECSGF